MSAKKLNAIVSMLALLIAGNLFAANLISDNSCNDNLSSEKSVAGAAQKHTNKIDLYNDVAPRILVNLLYGRGADKVYSLGTPYAFYYDSNRSQIKFIGAFFVEFEGEGEGIHDELTISKGEFISRIDQLITSDAYYLSELGRLMTKLGVTPNQNIPSSQQRISKNSRQIFIRDARFPLFGEAWRDPSGLVWSEPSSDGMAFREAPEYCKSRGGRLPSAAEFEALSRYLGNEGNGGYSTYVYGSKTEIIPDLTDGLFWTSSYNTEDDNHFTFNGETGVIGAEPPFVGLKILCVGR